MGLVVEVTSTFTISPRDDTVVQIGPLESLFPITSLPYSYRNNERVDGDKPQ